MKITVEKKPKTYEYPLTIKECPFYTLLKPDYSDNYCMKINKNIDNGEPSLLFFTDCYGNPRSVPLDICSNTSKYQIVDHPIVLTIDPN